jgi:sugar lactone lactonase YvrE
MGLQSIFPTHLAISVWLRGLLLFALLSLDAAYSQTLATAVPLVLPSAIAFDSQGNLYIAETASHVVRKVDTTGNITTIVGTGTQGFDGDGGQATACLLDSPQGLVADTNSLYIADSHNHRVRKVDFAGGKVTTIAGTSSAGSNGDGGAAASATLDLPMALALDGKGDLYIADAGSHRIRMVDATGRISTVAGTAVQGFSGDGASAAASLLDSPGGLTIDSAGNLYIADTHNSRVRKIDHVTGIITTLAGSGAQGYGGDSSASQTAKLALPRGISLDQQGNVYIADAANHRVRRVDGATGVITTLAGDGTQGFTGDGGSPASASLDSPHAIAISPAGAGSIADTGNARIRQIVGGTSLQTIAGLGITVPGALTLTGPSTVSYGAGQLTATLTTPGATGSITFLDSYGGLSSTVATVVIGTNAAVLDTSALQAGQHSVTATYSGDQAHSSARSNLFALTVSPVALDASVIPAAIAYGQPVPVLTGQLKGVLPRDLSSVSAVFSTTATMLSSVGSYPVTIALTGSAAGNYRIATTPSIAITKAATTTTLVATAAQLANGITVSAGQVVTLTAHVASATSGVPTGTVTILDGGVTLGAARANASGDAVLATSTLSAGAHSLTAVYSGDGNFTLSASSPSLITVDAPQSGAPDFTLMTTGSVTQTAIAGSTASFTFTVQPQGGLSSQVSLAATGLPNLAAASFNPAYVPPGSQATTVTLTISTPKSVSVRRSASPIAFALLLFPFAGRLAHRGNRKRRTSLLGLLLLLSPLLFIMGCGDRVYTGDPAAQTSKTYTITVTGTATGTGGSAIEHAATVTLVVVPVN